MTDINLTLVHLVAAVVPEQIRRRVVDAVGEVALRAELHDVAAALGRETVRHDVTLRRERALREERQAWAAEVVDARAAARLLGPEAAGLPLAAGVARLLGLLEASREMSLAAAQVADRLRLERDEARAEAERLSADVRRLDPTGELRRLPCPRCNGSGIVVVTAGPLAASLSCGCGASPWQPKPGEPDAGAP